MFWSQIVATVIAGTVQLGVQAWMFTNIPDMCSPSQKDGFICPSTEVFGTASIIVRSLLYIGFLRRANSNPSGVSLAQLANSPGDKLTMASSSSSSSVPLPPLFLGL